MIRGSTLMNMILFLSIVTILFVFVGGDAYYYNPQNSSELSRGFGVMAAQPINSFFTYQNSSVAGQSYNNFNMYGWISYLLLGVGVAAGVAIAAAFLLTGTFTFPNPYIYFAGFAMALISSLVPIPYQLFNGLPQPLGALLILGLGSIILWAAINWFHTGENQ